MSPLFKSAPWLETAEITALNYRTLLSVAANV